MGATDCVEGTNKQKGSRDSPPSLLTLVRREALHSSEVPGGQSLTIWSASFVLWGDYWTNYLSSLYHCHLSEPHDEQPHLLRPGTWISGNWLTGDEPPLNGTGNRGGVSYSVCVCGPIESWAVVWDGGLEGGSEARGDTLSMMGVSGEAKESRLAWCWVGGGALASTIFLTLSQSYKLGPKPTVLKSGSQKSRWKQNHAPCLLCTALVPLVVPGIARHSWVCGGIAPKPCLFPYSFLSVQASWKPPEIFKFLSTQVPYPNKITFTDTMD